MNKKILLILILVFSIALLAACSQTTANESASASETVATAAATAAATTSPSAAATVLESATPAPEATVEESAAAEESTVESAAGGQGQVAVEVDLATEQSSQASVDEGHSPWRIDPQFVAQVFVCSIMEPEGITGDYPIPYESFVIADDNGTAKTIEVQDDSSPISRVYVEQLVKTGEDGIWTVVGYDPAE